MRRFHVQPHITIDWCFHYLQVMVVIEQLTQLFHSIVQFFRIGKNRLRITFVQRMNKAQQYLLHHVLGITKFLRVQ
ncbi:Uncharacterised protein [Shigella sonnei]|nr:Uncharacterised protein [Shigella sonnei]